VMVEWIIYAAGPPGGIICRNGGHVAFDIYPKRKEEGRMWTKKSKWEKQKFSSRLCTAFEPWSKGKCVLIHPLFHDTLDGICFVFTSPRVSLTSVLTKFSAKGEFSCSHFDLLYYLGCFCHEKVDAVNCFAPLIH
jgi:hypothetical protein